MTAHIADVATAPDREKLEASAREFLVAWRQSDLLRIAPLLLPDCEWYRNGRPVDLAGELDTCSRAPANVTTEIINVDDHSASALVISNGPDIVGRRPVGFINLQFSCGGISKVSEATRSVTRSRASWGRAVLTVLAGIAGCLLDELIFSIPVIAVAAMWHPWPTFLLFTPIYFAFAALVSLLIFRRRGRRGAISGSALARWLDARADRHRTRWEARAIVGFNVLGTAVVTIALGPILTPWLAHRMGLDRHFGRLVVLGALAWSVCLVGTYSGLVALAL